MKRENFFYKGSKVHFINNINLAICGSGWLNGSYEQEDITCEDCNRILIVNHYAPDIEPQCVCGHKRFGHSRVILNDNLFRYGRCDLVGCDCEQYRPAEQSE